MKPIPDELRTRPFAYAEAKALGLSAHNLQGRRFRRVHPRVYCCAELELTWEQEVEAARLAMPDDALITGLTRIRMAGVDFGPPYPIRFVVARDHHIALVGIFLHRTTKLPPHDEDGVVIEAAFIAFCAQARVIDAIKVGDRLLNLELMTIEALVALALAEQWRDGADEALWIVGHLDGRSRSMPESEGRMFLIAAGLGRPEPNLTLELPNGRTAIGDLVYLLFKLIVEYEGEHHQENRDQYLSDIDRYDDLRGDGYEYVQITKETQRSPKRMVRKVYDKLVERGYDGPAPVFGEAWALLFVRVSFAVERTRRRSA